MSELRSLYIKFLTTEADKLMITGKDNKYLEYIEETLTSLKNIHTIKWKDDDKWEETNKNE